MCPGALSISICHGTLVTSFPILQEFIQTYITSMTSLEESQILQMSKDPSGSRVVEAFLSSNASMKQKRRFVLKYVLLCCSCLTILPAMVSCW